MGYRENILEVVEKDSKHPFKNGVKMQAHHLVSKKGLTLSGLEKELKQLGYDINVLENLALFPCTLQGACQLGVQLHRGDHATRDVDFRNDNDDDDREHRRSYHRTVKVALLNIEKELRHGQLCNAPAATIQGELNNISRKMMSKIRKFKVPLTSIYTNFKRKEELGCCGVDSIGEVDRSQPCPTHRYHGPTKDQPKGSHGPRQQPEEFQYSGKSYKLRVGR